MSHSTSDLTVLAIDTPTLGDGSYLVHDGEVAFVVDPQRVIDRVLTLLDEHGPHALTARTDLTVRAARTVWVARRP